MKDALCSITAGRKGQGNQGGFRRVGRLCSRREADLTNRQTDGITRQVARMSTIFVPVSEEISGSFVGKGLAVKRNAEFRLQVDVPHLQAQHEAKL